MPSRTFLRERNPHEHVRVGFIELFFDLVFVFAITQLSHTLLHHLTLEGALEVGLLFLAVWWVWIYTTWVTNWLDTDRAPVRLFLLALMLAGLVLSTSLPDAFGNRGLAFAAAYVAMQLGRPLYMLWAIGDANPTNTRNFKRISCWAFFSGILWIAGGIMEGETRLALWVAALAIEYAGPFFSFYVPGLGRSRTGDWDIEGAHMAERCGLFMIIALGESVLVTGATFAELEWNAVHLAGFVTAFLATVAMWWIYFDTGVKRGETLIADSEDPGRIARLAYTYIHLLIVAGIIVNAVADELVLAHPLGHAEPAAIAAIFGGPALYLVGNIMFKRLLAAHMALSHLVGLGLLAALLPFSLWLPPLALAIGSTAVLVLVAIWETISIRGLFRKPSAPSPS
ncbi:MAG: low temperature requirement protein A [Parvibaculum sp.]